MTKTKPKNAPDAATNATEGRRDWKASEIKPLSPAVLRPYKGNARTHPEAQLLQVMASIQEFGFTSPVLIDEAQTILAGHGRVEAAKRLGLAEVPTITVAGLSEAQKRAYVLADNKIALNAEWDESILREELKALDEMGFDLTVTGFDEASIVSFISLGLGIEAGPEEASGLSDNYSRKIEAPIYEIRGERPAESELVNRQKADELKAEIEAAEMPGEVRAFLLQAAERHAVFNFSKIAEYYAHAPASTQRLMERSALVIIDFDKAVEGGFVRLNESLMKLAGEEQDAGAAEDIEDVG